ncbi:sensor histidine kinase [Sulfurospirillum sp. 1612]|uniref:sensor histidine kinase n=1 Tax=Sulfurospirillum sp. 1612 TaxID=3094835 RepID=UPI002F95CC5F
MTKLLHWLHSQSIYTKLAFLIFMIIFIFSSLIVVLAIDTSKKQTNEIINEMIDSNIQSNKDFLTSAILANDRWALFKFLKSFSQNSAIKDAGIIDKHSIVLAHTDTARHKMGTRLDDPEEHKILPFKKDGVLLGYFVLDIEKSSIKNMLERSFSTNFLIMTFAAVFSFLFAIYFMKNLLDRLNILRDNTKAISLKKWDDIREIQSVENDEITDLVKTTTLLLKEIKESVKKEEELKNFYQRTLASVDVFIVICDEDLNIMYQNEHPISTLLLEENQFKSEYITNLIQCYQNHSCTFCKQKITNDLGEDLSLYYQIQLVNEYLVISFSDITQLSKLEENEKILHSLKTLGEISSLFAHEIKNLLQPLKLLLQEDEEIDKEDLHIIHNTLNRMDAQVIDFLSLGKPIDQRDIVALPIQKSLDELLAILQPKLQEHHIHIKQYVQDGLHVKISKNSFEMIVLNLINNAIDAIKQKGNIEISWVKKPNQMSELKITDSGCGIPKTLRKKIFKPFFTTKSHGSGLGLFTVYKIVYLSGGQIHIADDDTTTFIIKLPQGELS